MKYRAYLVQKSGGCDHTIGCGLKILNLRAQEKEDAKVELAYLIKENYSHDDAILSLVELYEINDIFTFDIDSFYQELKDEKLSKIKNEKDKSDYQEYLRLKNKFEV